MLVSVFYIVHILGGTQPGVTLIPGTAMTNQECQETADVLRGQGPVLTDPVTKRPVIMTFYECVLQDPEQQLKEWQDAVESGMANR